MIRLMATAFVIFALLSFNPAYAKNNDQGYIKTHTEITSNSTKNGNNLIKKVNNLVYDADLDITWYYDPTISAIDWQTAMNWADSFKLGPATDWRLPFASDPNPSGYVDISTGGELGHLYSELGNTGNGLTSSFPFDNLQAVNYWTNTLTTTNWFTEHAYAYSFKYGYMGHADITLTNGFGVLLVHPGNIKTPQPYKIGTVEIPEPGILLLLAPGLTGLALMRRKLTHRK